MKVFVNHSRFKKIMREGIAGGLFAYASTAQTHIKTKVLNRGGGNGVPSVAPNPPHRQTATMSRSVLVDRSALRESVQKVRIGSRLGYARQHEFGLGVPKRPWLSVGLKQSKDKSQQAFTKVFTKKVKSGSKNIK